MFAFQFRLATLLRLRIAERDERRSELAKALAAGEIIHRQRRSLLAERDENRDRIRRAGAAGSGNVDALIHGHRYEAILKGRAAQLAAQEVQVEREIERRREVLVEADRQVKVLEKLRERKAAEHRSRQDKLEARQLEEVGSIGHFRRRRAEP